MNKPIAMAIVVITLTFSIIFGAYAFFGFLSWIFSDPLSWITPPPKVQYVENPDVLACRARGGLAVTSIWDNRLKKCQL